MTACPARRRAAGSAIAGASGDVHSLACDGNDGGAGAGAMAGAARAPGGALRFVATLLVLLALGAGCGDPGQAPAGDAWPLSLDEPGLLAYTALALPADVQSGMLRGLLDWEPGGLRDAAPLLVVHLDEKTYGGPVAILLPVADREAFRASLQACASLHELGDGRWRYDVPPESPLRIMSLMLSGMQGGSPLAMLGSLTDAPQTSFTFELADEGGHAILAPSFESTGACRRVLRSTGGFLQAPPHTLVASLDLARLRLVYAEQIKESENQLRSLLSGAGTAGAFGAVAMMGRGEGGGGPQLPVNWELIWALKDMFAMSNVEALQFSVDASPQFWELVDRARAEAPDDETGPRDEDREDDVVGEEDGTGLERQAAYAQDAWDAFLELPELAVRARLAPGSPLRTVAAAGAPAPEIDGAALVLAADAPRFAPAFAQWCRPIAEVVKGRGPPAQRYLDELSGLVGAWDGLLALMRTPDDGLLLLGSVAPGRGPEGEAWSRWLQPLLATARVEGFSGELVTAERPGGVNVVLSADGEVAMSYGFADDVAWAALGEVTAPPAAELSAFRAAQAMRTPASAADGAVSVLRAALPDATLDAAVRGDELRLTWRPSARER